MAPDIQLILVVTEQDAEVWLLHGESQLVRLVDQLPGVSRSAFHGSFHDAKLSRIPVLYHA